MDERLRQLRIQIVRHHHDAPERRLKRKDNFRKVSVKVANKLGTPAAFYIAFFLIVTWAVTGPIFKFSDTWQLIINTGTTIITFLMVFVIQNTQNRDSRALHLKMDELIKTQRGARDEFVDIEDLSDTELDELQDQFKELHKLVQKEDAKR